LGKLPQRDLHEFGQPQKCGKLVHPGLKFPGRNTVEVLHKMEAIEDAEVPSYLLQETPAALHQGDLLEKGLFSSLGDVAKDADLARSGEEDAGRFFSSAVGANIPHDFAY